jgi:hypothetical protein
LNGTHKLLIFVDNYVGQNINTIKNTSSVRSYWGGERTNYMVMFHHQNLGQNHNLLIANKSLKNVIKCKYLGMTGKVKIAYMKKS